MTPQNLISFLTLTTVILTTIVLGGGIALYLHNLEKNKETKPIDNSSEDPYVGSKVMLIHGIQGTLECVIYEGVRIDLKGHKWKETKTLPSENSRMFSWKEALSFVSKSDPFYLYCEQRVRELEAEKELKESLENPEG